MNPDIEIDFSSFIQILSLKDFKGLLRGKTIVVFSSKHPSLCPNSSFNSEVVFIFSGYDGEYPFLLSLEDILQKNYDPFIYRKTITPSYIKEVHRMSLGIYAQPPENSIKFILDS